MLKDPKLTRTVHVPDELRIQRSLRAPELGPRILFFSGGSALRPLCRVLKQYTHNSVHLITAFDSGGSSAKLRQTFGMPAIGDLRNRIVALADESVRGNPDVYRLFSYRLPLEGSRPALNAELERLARGEHALLERIAEPMRRIVRAQLESFRARMPADFDLRGANIGNLLLAGGYLENGRDLESVLFLFSKLLEVRGTVLPIVDRDLHLCAELEDGRRVVGQHLLTGKEAAPLGTRICGLSLVDGAPESSPVRPAITTRVRHEIETAELICFPMGSFFTSVIANLLPLGVGRAIASAGCPRVYIPNTGHDPEQHGMSLADGVEAIIRSVRDDAGSDVPTSRILNLVLLDRDPSRYTLPLDIGRVTRLGIQVMTLDLASEASAPHAAPQRLAEALLSLV